MAQLKFGAAGVTANEIDLSGPVEATPTGVPAGIIGTSHHGPAFVPVTVGFLSSFQSKFGTIDSAHFGPLAVYEWLNQGAGAVTYLRVLGIGDGLKRQAGDGNYPGSVTTAGFVVGENQPHDVVIGGVVNPGVLSSNPNANANGEPGRTYFLGCYMSESLGSTVFSEAGLQKSPDAIPVLRGVIMAASGVLLSLSSSLATNSSAPLPSAVGSTKVATKGSTFGSVVLFDNSTTKQDFVMLLNGHVPPDDEHPNVVTASFDFESRHYFATKLNHDPEQLEKHGYCLYANWDIHTSVAVLTGVGILSSSHGADAAGAPYGGRTGIENSAFLVTSSLARNSGSSYVPNFESFEDRFRYAKSPWIISQKFGGKPLNLFRFHALDAGADISTLYKISIDNITPSSDPANKYGSFAVKVRKWDNSDKNGIQLIEKNESFQVDLNPTSSRYIGKVIGDMNTYFDFDRDEDEQKITIEGNYPNRSNYIRVEVHPDVENGFLDPTALPMGFRGIQHLVTSGSAIFPAVPATPANDQDVLPYSGGSLDPDILRKITTLPLPMRRKQTDGKVGQVGESYSQDYYWGVQFELEKDPTQPNKNIVTDASLSSFAKYFPDFSTEWMPMVVGDNDGVQDTEKNGIMDSDRYCYNLFSLENIQVVTGSGANALMSDDVDKKMVSAVYVRNGNIPNEDKGTRAFEVRDLTNTTIRNNFGKFTLLLQGGFNGINIFDSDEAALNNNAVSDDMVYPALRGLNHGPNVKAYQKAIDIMKNTTNIDIQLMSIPGIRHPIITDYATVAVEDRFDALYIMDIEQFQEGGFDASGEVRKKDDKTSVYDTINSFKNRNVNSSFAAAYFPDVNYAAPDNQSIFVPPSVLVMGALALNDRLGHPWFAPAGFTRGALPTRALEARVKLKTEDLDTLYNERINPLVAFQGGNPHGGLSPASGVVVWGQKTLQLAASSLDRVNVRRLLIEIRRQVREIAQTIIFEPNRAATLARFSAAVTPRLQRIQNLAGLERFKVIIDSSTTTQTDVENNTVRGKIYVQPTKSIEFVSLDFVVANNLQQVT